MSGIYRYERAINYQKVEASCSACSDQVWSDFIVRSTDLQRTNILDLLTVSQRSELVSNASDHWAFKSNEEIEAENPIHLKNQNNTQLFILALVE